MMRALASALLAALLVGAGAAPASAHATLVATDPAEGEVLAEAPAEVTLTFDEPVALVADAVGVHDASGERVAASATARDAVVTVGLPDGLADGTYVVVWRVVSADTHPVAGSLTFSIGAPSETVAVPQVGTDAVNGSLQAVLGTVQGGGYVALLLVGGLLFFRGWTARGARLHVDVRRRLARIERVGAAVAITAAAVQVPLAGAYQLGRGPGALFDQAAYDVTLVGDNLLVLALQVLGLPLAIRFAGTDGPAGTLGAVAGLGALWSPALVGHTRAYEPESLLVVTDALHLSAGAVWLGGLIGLGLALPSLAGRERDAARLLSRFTTMAATVLAVLAVTGVLLGWRILGAWAPLVQTGYGRLLLIKVALAALVVGVAAWNRFRLVPRMAVPGHDPRRRAGAVLRRTVAAEAALLVALLGVTGFLVLQPPSGGSGTSGPAPSGTGAATVATEDHRVVVVVEPGGGRERSVLVQVQDATGEPVDLADLPRVSLASADVDLGEVPVAPESAGTYRADVVFPALGEWQVQVSLPVDRFTTPVTTATVTVD